MGKWNLWGAGGVAPALPMVSGRYYFAPAGAHTTSASLGNGSLRLSPFFVPNPVTLSRIGGEITVVGDAASVLRLGIYNDDGTGRPGNLVLDAGTISGNSATVQEITISQPLNAGWYWFGGAVQGVTTTQPTVRTLNVIQSIDVGTVIPASGMSMINFLMSGVTGALPSVTSGLGTGGGGPRVFLKVA